MRFRSHSGPAPTSTPPESALTSTLQGLTITTQSSPDGPQLVAAMTQAQVKQRQDYAIEQNVTTLRNRVNELGVSEPIVQRQGVDRIDVQLPGIQNAAEVKNLLGQIAQLEFRLRTRPATRSRRRRPAMCRWATSSTKTPRWATRCC